MLKESKNLEGSAEAPEGMTMDPSAHHGKTFTTCQQKLQVHGFAELSLSGSIAQCLRLGRTEIDGRVTLHQVFDCNGTHLSSRSTTEPQSLLEQICRNQDALLTQGDAF